MSNITLSQPVFYKAGVGGVSAVVGYESHSNRVARYSFTAPDMGASAVSLAFVGNWPGNGTMPNSLGFYIGTAPDSHIDAGEGSPYTGTLTRQTDSYTFTGSEQVLLLPGVNYYLWIFPQSTTFGWFQWSRDGAAMTVSGAASSALKVEAGVLGEPLTLSIEAYGDFTHTLSCAFGGQSIPILDRSGATACTWTPPLSLANAIPDAVSAVAVYTLTTYEGTTVIGSRQVSAALSVPESAVPAVAFTWEDTGTDCGLVLQNVSVLSVTARSSGIYGSSIRSTAVTLDGAPYSGVVKESGEHILAVTVTDSRGRKGSASQTLTVTAYEKPKLTLTALRCDADGTENDMGEFARLTANAQRTPLDLPCTLSVGGQSAADTALTVIVPAASVSAHTFAATFTDSVMTVSAQVKIPIGYATVDFLAGGRGIAFGTTATAEGFTCAMATDHLGHRVTGIPTPVEESDAASKAYVDSQRVQVAPPLSYVDGVLTLTQSGGLAVFGVEADTPVPLSVADGEQLSLCYVTDYRTNGDIFLKVNGAAPTAASYGYTASNTAYSGGIVAFSGANHNATFSATACLLGGRFHVFGMGLRGNGSGVGTAYAVWEVDGVESLTFTRAGTLYVRRMQ